MGFPLRLEFANENHDEAGSWKQCNDQRTDQTTCFLAPIITDFIRNTKRELYDEKLEDALENSRFGMEQRRRHQGAVQPVEPPFTSPRKCVQQDNILQKDTYNLIDPTDHIHPVGLASCSCVGWRFGFKTYHDYNDNTGAQFLWTK